MQIRQRYNSAIINKYEIQSKKYAKCTLFHYLGQDTKKLMRIFSLTHFKLQLRNFYLKNKAFDLKHCSSFSQACFLQLK